MSISLFQVVNPDIEQTCCNLNHCTVLAIPGVVRANPDASPTHISSSSSYDQIFLSEIESVERYNRILWMT